MFYKRIFRELARPRIKYAVAGGMAVNIYGYIRSTVDLDIILLLEEDNIAKFIALVKKIGFIPRVPVDIDDFLSSDKRRDWIAAKCMKVSCVYNPACEIEQVDVMIDPALDIQGLFSRSVLHEIYGIEVPVVSLADLIAMKTLAGRGRDLDDINNLRHLLGG